MENHSLPRDLDPTPPRSAGHGAAERAPRRLALGLVPTLALLLPALEMILMATPFAVYFYGAYSPVLQWTRSSVDLIWLGDFFVPHLTKPSSSLLRLLFQAPRYLLHLGLAGFALHAVHLYWTKLVRKTVARRLLYRYVRHPQYLCLAVAGVGLVFHWPRFLNLALYLVMLAGYVWLARDEEKRMLRAHGDAYPAYRAAAGMFLPQRMERPLAVLWRRVPASGLFRTAAVAAILVAAFSLSFALRALALRTVDADAVAGNALVLFLEPPAPAERSMAREAAARLVPPAPRKGSVTMFYAVRTEKELRHLLVDSGFSYRHLTRAAIPAARFYLVRAEASYPCAASCKVMERAREALEARALRTPVAIHRLGGGGSRGGMEDDPLAPGALYRHAMMPSL